MSRRPTDAAKDAALWQRVAATVRPLGSKAPAVRALPRVSLRATAPETPAMPQARAAITPAAATLDGGWERRARTGRLVADAIIDLHGHTQAEAFAALEDAVARAWHRGCRVLLIITGKPREQPHLGTEPRGAIAASFHRWIEAPALRPYIAAARPAHPRHGGRGAWYVVLRRRRQHRSPGA
jgi:DNA-nicking Smr family endonuclease